MSDYDGPIGMRVTLATHTPPNSVKGVIVDSSPFAVTISVRGDIAGNHKVIIYPWSVISWIRED